VVLECRYNLKSNIKNLGLIQIVDILECRFQLFMYWALFVSYLHLDVPLQVINIYKSRSFVFIVQTLNGDNRSGNSFMRSGFGRTLFRC